MASIDGATEGVLLLPVANTAGTIFAGDNFCGGCLVRTGDASCTTATSMTMANNAANNGQQTICSKIVFYWASTGKK